MNKNLQYAITKVLPSYSTNVHEQNIYGCVLYKYLYNTIQYNTSVKNTLASLVESYIGNIVNRINSLKNNYLSYNLMMLESERIGKESFTEYTDTDVSKIYTFYLDKTKLSPFSVKHFKQSMYKINNLTQKEYKKLLSIHKNVMIPICLYYMQESGISENNLEIYTVKQTSEDIVGNEIVFSIYGIIAARVVSDISLGKIPITFQDIKVDGTYVKLLL